MDTARVPGKHAALTVKLTNQLGVTRRCRETPQSYSALKEAVKVQILKNKGDPAEYALSYEDDQGDTI